MSMSSSLNVNVSLNGPILNSGTNSDFASWRPIAAIRRCGPTSTSNSTWSIATINRRYGTCPSTAPFSSRRMSPSVQLSLPLKPGQFPLTSLIRPYNSAPFHTQAPPLPFLPSMSTRGSQRSPTCAVELQLYVCMPVCECVSVWVCVCVRLDSTNISISPTNEINEQAGKICVFLVRPDHQWINYNPINLTN